MKDIIEGIVCLIVLVLVWLNLSTTTDKDIIDIKTEAVYGIDSGVVVRESHGLPVYFEETFAAPMLLHHT